MPKWGHITPCLSLLTQLSVHTPTKLKLNQPFIRNNHYLNGTLTWSIGKPRNSLTGRSHLDPVVLKIASPILRTFSIPTLLLLLSFTPFSSLNWVSISVTQIHRFSLCETSPATPFPAQKQSSCCSSRLVSPLPVLYSAGFKITAFPVCLQNKIPRAVGNRSKLQTNRDKSQKRVNKCNLCCKKPTLSIKSNIVGG